MKIYLPVDFLGWNSGNDCYVAVLVVLAVHIDFSVADNSAVVHTVPAVPDNYPKNFHNHRTGDLDYCNFDKDGY